MSSQAQGKQLPGRIEAQTGEAAALGPVFDHGQHEFIVAVRPGQIQFVEQNGQQTFKKQTPGMDAAADTQRPGAGQDQSVGQAVEAGRKPVARVGEVIAPAAQMHEGAQAVVIAQLDVVPGRFGRKLHQRPQILAGGDGGHPGVLFVVACDAYGVGAHGDDAVAAPLQQHIDGAIVVNAAVDEKALAHGHLLEAGKGGAGQNIGRDVFLAHFLLEDLHSLKIWQGKGDDAVIDGAGHQLVGVDVFGDDPPHIGIVDAAVGKKILDAFPHLGQILQLHLPQIGVNQLFVFRIVNILAADILPELPGLFVISLGDHGGVHGADRGAGHGLGRISAHLHTGLNGADVKRALGAAALQCDSKHG